MLGRDPSAPPIAGRGRIPSVKEKKSQICKEEVRYLGFVLKEDTRLLDQSRKEVILRLPTPKTRRQVREFLRATGFCRIWIPRHSHTAQPLSELLKVPEENPVNWTEKQQKAFEELRLAITSAPALGLPDLTEPFTLYVTEKDKTAMGGLTQTLGTWDRPIAYLSKRLDNVASGWPGCLRKAAAVALLVREATKLTFSQDLIVKVPHEVNTLLGGDSHKWLSNSRIIQYQGLLCENLNLCIEPCQGLNQQHFSQWEKVDLPTIARKS